MVSDTPVVPRAKEERRIWARRFTQYAWGNATVTRPVPADGTIYIVYDFERTGAKEILVTKYTEADFNADHSKTGTPRFIVNYALS
jgi:hypothetical protein